MMFSEKNLVTENFNFTLFDANFTFIKVSLNILSFIIAAILWAKFDFSFYYVAITLFIIFNTICLVLYYLVFSKTALFFNFLACCKELLYKFSKFYKIIFIIAIGYFFKNIVNLYLMNDNFTDYIIFMLSMVSFVCLYRYKQEYEFKIQSVISEDNNYMEVENEKAVLQEKKFETITNNNDNINSSELSLPEIEKIDNIENKQDEQVNLQEDKKNMNSEEEKTFLKEEKFEALSDDINNTTKDKNLPILKAEQIDCIKNTENEKVNFLGNHDVLTSEKEEKLEATLDNNNTIQNENLSLSEVNKIDCIKNNEEKIINIQLEKPKNSDTKYNSKKNMKFIFYKLFSNIITIEKAKDLPFEKFYKLLCDTYKGQTVTIEHINFIFEKNKFYKLKPNNKKKHYKKKSLKTTYSLFRNNKLI